MVLEGPDNKLRLKIMVGYKFNVADILLKRNMFLDIINSIIQVLT